MHRERTQSMRSKWNVSLDQQHDASRYKAIVSYHSQVAFRRAYDQETTAGLAADMANVAVHGSAARGRLNFPSGGHPEENLIDIDGAAQVLETDLTQAGYPADARQYAQQAVSEVASDVVNGIRDFVLGCRIEGSWKSQCLARVRKLQEDMNVIGSGRRRFASGLDVHSDIPERAVDVCDKMVVERTVSEDLDTSPRAGKDEEADDRRQHRDAEENLTNRIESEPAAERAGFHETSENRSPSVSSEDRRSDGDARSVEEAIDGNRLLDKMEVDTASSGIDYSRTLSNTELLREEAELLLCLRDVQPNILLLRSGCTKRNLAYIFLTQSSIHKIIDLDRLLLSHGWDLSTAGFDLLKGVAVLIAHDTDFKVRRIVSWDRITMHLTLEDGMIVSPLHVSNSDLDENIHSDYVVEELNYQIEQSNLKPILLHEVTPFHKADLRDLSCSQLACVYARLSACGYGLTQINRGCDSGRFLQELAQQLINIRNDTPFVEKFKPFVDPMSVIGMEMQSKLHQNMRNKHRGDSLQKIFQSWLKRGHTDEDLDLENEMIRCAQEMRSSADSGPMPFRFASRQATDPRRPTRSSRRFKSTTDRSIGIRAPRKALRLAVDRHRSATPSPIGGLANQRARTRSVSTLHREVRAQCDFQRMETAYANLIDLERALRTTKRELNSIPF